MPFWRLKNQVQVVSEDKTWKSAKNDDNNNNKNDTSLDFWYRLICA